MNEISNPEQDPQATATSASEKLAFSFESRLKANKNLGDKFADLLTDSFGTIAFLTLNAAFFFVWIFTNMGLLMGVAPFDPYPFGFLTMVVSLEAIFLSIFVLISQNRAGKLADLRQEMDFIINIKAEEEITRILNMLDEIHDHLGLDPDDDAELTLMKQKIDLNKLHQKMLDRV